MIEEPLSCLSSPFASNGSGYDLDIWLCTNSRFEMLHEGLADMSAFQVFHAV